MRWLARNTLACLEGVAILVVTAAGVIALSLVSSARGSIDARDAQVKATLAERSRSVAAFVKDASASADRQASTLHRIDQVEEQLQRRESCDEIIPTHKVGLGILQVASVRESRGDDTAEFAANQVSRLKAVLKAGGVPIWWRHLTHYLGREDEPIRRVAFNNIDEQAGAEMCAWLRCKKWSGGCAFVTEQGDTETDPTPTKYEPTEDLYEMWVSSVQDRGRPGGG